MSEPMEVNQYGTPKQKLPDCPSCGLDELGLIGHYLLCYACGRERIVEVRVIAEAEAWDGATA